MNLRRNIVCTEALIIFTNGGNRSVNFSDAKEVSCVKIRLNDDPGLNYKICRMHCVIGILRGEGIGPSLLEAGLRVLERVAELSGNRFEVKFGQEIGYQSFAKGRGWLPEEVREFSRGIFAEKGVIWAGAGGGRFVYEMRQTFSLSYKINPIQSHPELAGACRLKPPLRPVDILLLRENLEGIYQGQAEDLVNAGGREVRQTFQQSEGQVRIVLAEAVRLAGLRRKKITVVCKDAGLPVLHGLWRECALEATAGRGLALEMLDIDYAVYKLVQMPWEFDVVVAPNCFGDILADLGGVIAGSRGLTFGGSFGQNGEAVYQTNHGAAFDLAGKDGANPVGQFFSLAMLLRMSFGLEREAAAIEEAISAVWRGGVRTADLAESGAQTVGTAEFADAVVQKLRLPET